MSAHTCKPTTTVEGQYVLVTCPETGAEGIYSGTEAGSYEAWVAEHVVAHVDRSMAGLNYAMNMQRRGRTLQYGLRYS